MTSEIPSTSEPGNHAATNASERFKYLFTTNGLPLINTESTGILSLDTFLSAFRCPESFALKSTFGISPKPSA